MNWNSKELEMNHHFLQFKLTYRILGFIWITERESSTNTQISSGQRQARQCLVDTHEDLKNLLEKKLWYGPYRMV